MAFGQGAQGCTEALDERREERAALSELLAR